jgi:DNA-directed RNA polymerase specialized sigma24 family protein
MHPNDGQPLRDGWQPHSTPTKRVADRRGPGRRASQHFQRVSFACEDWGAWNERDSPLLKRIVAARAHGDERSARLVAGELLTPYLRALRTLVARRTARMRLQPCDREEIVSGAVERVVRDLLSKPDLGGVPLGAVVAVKVRDQISDFVRGRSARVDEEPTAPGDLPESPVHARPTPVEQAEAAATLLHPLGPCERAIVYERYVLDLSIGDVAASRGIQPDAVKKACTRGARKIREAHDAKSMSTFLAPRPELKDEGSIRGSEKAASSAGLSNKGKSLSSCARAREERKERQ